MATLLAHIRIKPGSEAQFETTVRALYASSHASEKALRRYEYWRGKSPNCYYCLESFDDYAGFLAHETTPHHEAAAEPIMALIEAFELEWVDPVPDAAPLATTHDQPLDAGADERTRFYAGMFPLTLARWWRDLPRGRSATLAGEAR